MGKQIVKSADSIGANIAEGSGKGNSLDYIRFLKIREDHYLRQSIGLILLLKEIC